MVLVLLGGGKIRTIRNNTFETNSSSTHSITITSIKSFQDFKDNKKYLCYETFYTTEEIYATLKKDLDSDWLKDKESAIKKIDDLIQREDYISEYIDIEIEDEKDREVFDDITSCFGELKTYTYISEIDCENEYFEKHETIEDVDVVAFGTYGYS